MDIDRVRQLGGVPRGRHAQSVIEGFLRDLTGLHDTYEQRIRDIETGVTQVDNPESSILTLRRMLNALEQIIQHFATK